MNISDVSKYYGEQCIYEKVRTFEMRRGSVHMHETAAYEVYLRPREHRHVDASPCAVLTWLPGNGYIVNLTTPLLNEVEEEIVAFADWATRHDV